jgi:hypothetical protein
MTRRRNDVGVLVHAVLLVPDLTRRPVEDASINAEFAEHRPHLLRLTEVLRDQNELGAPKVEAVFARVLDVVAHAFVLAYSRNDDAYVFARHATTF